MQANANPLPLLRKQKEECIQRREWARALELAEQIAQQEPTAANLCEQASILLKLERYQEAAILFNKSLALDFSCTPAQQGFARAREKLLEKNRPALAVSQTVAMSPQSQQEVLAAAPTMQPVDAGLDDTASALDRTARVDTGNRLPEVSATDSRAIASRPAMASTKGRQKSSVKADTAMPGNATRTAASAPAASGQATFARYQILKDLGQGGMGKVYHAHDPMLKRDVALKTILGAQEEGNVKRFLREAEVMARLNHANIVRVFDVGSDNDRMYFAMELIAGKSLDKYLREDKPAVRRCVEIMAKVAQAIAYAHKEGVLHRDIKPANIMLDEQGEPKVMDFGLALDVKNASSRLSCSGMAVGTPMYMSPEQALGRRKEIDARSDVYALGAVLYEMVAGKPPFHAANFQALQEQILHKEPVRPSRVSGRVPAALDRVCLKALAKEKERRYQSVEELADDLCRFLAGRQVNARDESFIHAIGRWLRRNRAAVITGIVCCALMLVVYAGISLQARQPVRQPPERPADKQPPRQQKPPETTSNQPTIPSDKPIAVEPSSKPLPKPKVQLVFPGDDVLQLEESPRFRNEVLRERMQQQRQSGDTAAMLQTVEQLLAWYVEVTRYTHAQYCFDRTCEEFPQFARTATKDWRAIIASKAAAPQYFSPARQKTWRVLRHFCHLWLANADKQFAVSSSQAEQALAVLADGSLPDLLPPARCFRALCYLIARDVKNARAMVDKLPVVVADPIYPTFSTCVADRRWQCIWPEVELVRGMCDFFAGDRQQAETQLRKVVKEFDWYPSVDRHLANIAEQYIQALYGGEQQRDKMWLDVSAHLSTFMATLVLRGVIAAKQRMSTGDYQPAVEMYQNLACTEESHVILTYHHLGTIYLQLRRWPESIECFTLARRLQPTFNDPVFYLGEVARFTDNIAEARRYFLYCRRHPPEWTSGAEATIRQFLDMWK